MIPCWMSLDWRWKRTDSSAYLNCIEVLNVGTVVESEWFAILSCNWKLRFVIVRTFQDALIMFIISDIKLDTYIFSPTFSTNWKDCSTWFFFLSLCQSISKTSFEFVIWTRVTGHWQADGLLGHLWTHRNGIFQLKIFRRLHCWKSQAKEWMVDLHED